jgi:hypothetical protein
MDIIRPADANPTESPKNKIKNVELKKAKKF